MSVEESVAEVVQEFHTDRMRGNILVVEKDGVTEQVLKPG